MVHVLHMDSWWRLASMRMCGLYNVHVLCTSSLIPTPLVITHPPLLSLAPLVITLYDHPPPPPHSQHHQHFICFRIDPCVDDEEGGRHLTVTEINCEPEHLSSANPYGVAFKVNETQLTRESEAQRMVDTVKSRSWKIKNYNSLNPVNGMWRGVEQRGRCVWS